MTYTREEFIFLITPYIQKYAKEYGYNQNVVPAIVAQACVESRNGNSDLASTYFNYFGMKCGSRWSGKSVKLSTKEEYTTGNITTIKDNFRVYDSIDDGVKGYFDFISSSRYANLKEASDYNQFIEYLKLDGYATSSSYVSTLKSVASTIKIEDSNVKEVQVCIPEVGKTYELLENMNVRSGAGTNFPKVGHKGLTPDGRNHDTDKNGSLDRGTRITCKDIFVNGSDIWVKCPSGWIAAYFGGKIYIKEV